MSDKETVVPRSLLEVWQWKDAIYEGVKDLPTDRALDEILQRARTVANKLDLPRRSASRTILSRDA